MRPAHYAREVFEGQLKAQEPYQRFNEARALCAGSCYTEIDWDAYYGASMRPAHYAREVASAALSEAMPVIASMRPAHYAREVPDKARGMGLEEPLQ